LQQAYFSILPPALLKQQKAFSKSIASQQLNTQLPIIEGNIKKGLLKLQLSENEFTVEDIFGQASPLRYLL